LLLPEISQVYTFLLPEPELLQKYHQDYWKKQEKILIVLPTTQKIHSSVVRIIHDIYTNGI